MLTGNRDYNRRPTLEAGLADRVRGGWREPDAFAFLKRLRLAKLAASLGGTESLAEHPTTMTHADVDPDTRQRLGISDALVRLSVGAENPEDIVDDLKQALPSGGGTEQRRS